MNVSNYQKQKIKSLKVHDKDEAFDLGIIIRNQKNERIGKLVPIGVWALRDDVILKEFPKWRQLFMSYFLVQFQASTDSTERYLTHYAVAKEDRILFAIYYQNEDLIGHVGYCNISENNVELDNMIRGKSGGGADFMYFVEKTILNWAFDILKVRSITAKVLSKNFHALGLHQQFGFQLIESYPLKKENNDNFVELIKCSEKDSTENYALNIIKVEYKEFLSLIKD